MRRREFIGLLGGAAACPVAARAQPSNSIVGVLGEFPLGPDAIPMIGLRKGLAETGFFEGQNLWLETRNTTGARYDQLPTLAEDLVRLPVAVLVATGSARVAQAAKAVTTTIPIVFANGSDPVKVGLVAQMNRPDGNATGVSFYTSTLGPKRLELLREVIPKATTIAFLVNPTNPVTEGDVIDIEQAARSISQRIVVLSARNEGEIDQAFITASREGASALLVNVDAFFNSRRQQLAELSARYRMPASYNSSQYVRSGGLMSYGDDRRDSYRHVGVYVGRILRGARPADLPVLQPVKFELVINLKTAKALGLEIPATLLARADEVIE
jgi:putative ABC transport system substrate-binding protein